MNTITLPFEWKDARNHHSRFVTSLEGYQIDLLNLTKVFLNKQLDYDGNKIHFKSNRVVMPFNSKITVEEYLSNKPLVMNGIGQFSSHVVIKNVSYDKEIIHAYFLDKVSGLSYANKSLKLRTFGYPIEVILNKIEEIGTIYRATKDSFVVLNREDFYSWIGEELLTRDIYIERLINLLNKER